MANFIEIFLIYLSTALSFTEAYSGIRHRRSKMLHEDESDSLKDNPTFINTLVNENVKNAESPWSYLNMDINENENVLYDNQINEYSKISQYDEVGNGDEETFVKRAIIENEKLSTEDIEDNYEKTVEKIEIIENEKLSTEDIEDNYEKTVEKREIIINDEQHSTAEMEGNPEKNIVRRSIDDNESKSSDESWADLVISFSKLAKPYIPKKIRNLNLDWPQLETAVRSFSHVTTSDVTERSLNDSPLMATIRATTAAATPMIMDGVRALLGMVLDFVDNAGFVTNGHAISRRGVSKSVLDDIMDAFTAVLEHMTGAK